MADFFGQYSFVVDQLIGTGVDDGFFPGEGPALLVGGLGRDEVTLPYSFFVVKDGIDYRTGRARFRIYESKLSDSYIDVQASGVEKISFLDKSIELPPARGGSGRRA